MGSSSFAKGHQAARGRALRSVWRAFSLETSKFLAGHMTAALAGLKSGLISPTHCRVFAYKRIREMPDIHCVAKVVDDALRGLGLPVR